MERTFPHACLHGYIIFYFMAEHVIATIQCTLLPVVYEEALFPHSLINSALSSFLISVKLVSEKMTSQCTFIFRCFTF